MVEAAKKTYPYEAHGYLFNNNSVFEEGIASEKSVGHFKGSMNQIIGLSLKYNNKPPSSLFHSHPCAATPSGRCATSSTNSRGRTPIPMRLLRWIRS